MRFDRMIPSVLAWAVGYSTAGNLPLFLVGLFGVSVIAWNWDDLWRKLA